jgi:hypothetical protein
LRVEIKQVEHKKQTQAVEHNSVKQKCLQVLKMGYEKQKHLTTKVISDLKVSNNLV